MTTVACRAACLAIVVLAASCRSTTKPASAKPPFGSEPQGQRQAAVTHVVLVWLKTPGDEAGRRRVIDASKTFQTIPGVVSVICGTALPSTRPVVDWSYDVAVVMTFEDEHALRAYEGHPTHKKAVEEVLRPLAGKIVIYDFEVE